MRQKKSWIARQPGNEARTIPLPQRESEIERGEAGIENKVWYVLYEHSILLQVVRPFSMIMC